MTSLSTLIPVATDNNHIVHRAAEVLRTRPDLFRVLQFDIGLKEPAAGNLFCEVAAGRVQSFSHQREKGFFICGQQSKTYYYPNLHLNDAEYAANSDNVGDGESVPLIGARRITDCSRYTLLQEISSSHYYLIDREERVRSDALSEQQIVNTLCGQETKHVRIKDITVVDITREGIPHLGVGLERVGDPSDLVPGLLWRLLGRDNKNRLLLAEVLPQCSIYDVETKFQVPPPKTIDARVVDTIAHAALGTAGIVATAVAESAGAKLAGTIVTISTFAHAASRILRQPKNVRVPI